MLPGAVNCRRSIAQRSPYDHLTKLAARAAERAGFSEGFPRVAYSP